MENTETDTEAAPLGSGNNSPTVESTGDSNRSSPKPEKKPFEHFSSWIEKRWGTWSVILALLIGLGATGAILGLGIPAAHQTQEHRFLDQAKTLLVLVEKALADYEASALWAFQVSQSPTMDQKGFSDFFQYFNQSGIKFDGVAFFPNITHDERHALENRTLAFLEQAGYPTDTYLGIKTFAKNEEGVSVSVRDRPAPNRSWYFPAHLVAPLDDPALLFLLDLDMHSDTVGGAAIEQAIATGKLAMTRRFSPLQTFVGAESTYAVNGFHPGLPALDDPTKGVSGFVLRFDRLLRRVHSHFAAPEPIIVYLFDVTVVDVENPPEFLVGASLSGEDCGVLTFEPEIEWKEISRLSHRFRFEEKLDLTSREWIFVAVATSDTFKSELSYVFLAASMVFVASGLLALVAFSASRHFKLKENTKAEKIALELEHAVSASKQQKEMNEFLSHEVRNPLAAAMSACTFVQSNVEESTPLVTAESRKTTREDVRIIGTSLHFINDLLRDALDMQRAECRELKVKLAPVDILKDIFEPVVSILYQRDSEVTIEHNCPENLVVQSDCLRLKQIILNLARNSCKFVTKGFVRLRAVVAEGEVILFVEDSGCGIPESKRQNLFRKYQESLDTLSQGTGIGLSLCRHISELLEADISLDGSYFSGIDGYPGARIVINLKRPPFGMDAMMDVTHRRLSRTSSPVCSDTHFDNDIASLPEQLSVLFVDDDLVLRKLFVRSLKRIRPKWKISEASNGETCIRLCCEEQFSLIFVDQYMSSAHKQLLGTETVRELRSRGVKSMIWGLSANDMESAFLAEGANGFMVKPLPCERTALTKVLLRVLDCSNTASRNR